MTRKSVDIVGNAYLKPMELTKRYAQKDYPVLFIGERGVGKECFAKLYMASSSRKGKKLTINCAAFPSDLLRTEVFGHVKGAFTNAITDRDGKLQTCKNGILFLD